MPTNLSKPVSRRIGNLVVTITATGLELRAFHGQRKLVASYEVIAKKACTMKGDRPSGLSVSEWQDPLKAIGAK